MLLMRSTTLLPPRMATSPDSLTVSETVRAFCDTLAILMVISSEVAAILEALSLPSFAPDATWCDELASDSA